MAAVVAAIAAVTGGVISAVGQQKEGKAQKKALKHNAFIAQQNSDLIKKQTEQELHKAKTRRRRLLARQIAVAAASGRDISGGSPLAVIEASERAGILDEKIIDFNSDVARSGFSQQAGILTKQGKQIQSATKLGSYSTLLSSGGSAAGYFVKPAQ